MRVAKKYKRVIKNKGHNFGTTDVDKRVITVNKALHRKTKKNPKKYGFSKKDSTLLNTIVHEETHARHPRMHEKTVRRVARKVAVRLTPKQKKTLYGRFRR